MTTVDNPLEANVSPEPILQLAMGFMASKHLFVANAIGLFQHLADGPIILDEVAARSGAAPPYGSDRCGRRRGARPRQPRGGHVSNNPAADLYLSGRGPNDLRPWLRLFDRLSYPAWQQLESAVRSGQAPTRHGQFQCGGAADFLRGCGGVDRRSCPRTREQLRFWPASPGSGRRGGTGSFLLAMLRRYPDVQAALFELPTVVPMARQRLAGEALRRPVELVAGDFFTDPLPTGRDAIILANVVHLFSPERNRALLGRTRQAVVAGARLLLVDFWTDPTHTQPLPAALLAGEFPCDRRRGRRVQRSRAERLAPRSRLATAGASTAGRPSEPGDR